MRVALALIFLVPLVSAFGGDSPAKAPDCSRWAVGSVSIVMSFAEVKEAHPKGMLHENGLLLDARGKAWYSWAEDQMYGWASVLPSPNGDRIDGIQFSTDSMNVTVNDLIDALAEKWGKPLEEQGFRTENTNYDMITEKTTAWVDLECDATARVVHQRRLGPGNRELSIVLVRIDRSSALED